MPLEIPAEYYKPSKMNFAMGFTSLVAFSGGIYRGVCEAHGTPLAPNLENILLWGPIAASVPLSLTRGKEMMNDPRISSQMPRPPAGVPTEVENSAKGCSVGCSAVVGVGMVAFSHGLGYLLGSYIGKHS
jgi:hypothetical protein